MDDMISKPLDLALKMYYQEISKGIIVGSTPTSAPRVKKLTSEICNNWMKFLEVHREKNRLVYCDLITPTEGVWDKEEIESMLRNAKDAAIFFRVQKKDDINEEMEYSIHLEKKENIWHFGTIHWGMSQPILY